MESHTAGSCLRVAPHDVTVVNPQDLLPRLKAALVIARRELWDARAPGGHWVGELSSSALSTATAVCALAMADRQSSIVNRHSSDLIQRGLEWLAQHQNTDGGWGDTTLSTSNTSTTALCWAAFGVVPGGDEKHGRVVSLAEACLSQRAGGIDPKLLAPAIIKRYGKDRTFSVPILMTCALAGRLGPSPDAWRWVLPLPFELAACPHQWFAALRLPVVSYALPALIAIGQARHHIWPSRNPFARLCRNLTRRRTLLTLQNIQPSSGGFLEATPLTSFVVMSLAAAGNADHPVTQKGVEFLTHSARPDGSWPIDTNLATWVTTLAINALGGASTPEAGLAVRQSVPQPDGNGSAVPMEEWAPIREWLLAQQYREEHPYTHAAPGGWAWTHLPGGVPDADDTAGAVLALHSLGGIDHRTRQAALAGIHWLLNLQNRDGGIPTFCRGWGALPFDRSSPDLTAHALRAWAVWLESVPTAVQSRLRSGIDRAMKYLEQTQRRDGSWVPLWFGSQFAPDDENPTYGTARVVIALQELAGLKVLSDRVALKKGIRWILAAQGVNGGWGGFPGGEPSVEETALALEALSPLVREGTHLDEPGAIGEIRSAVTRGAVWLIRRVEESAWTQPTPMGFYFAKLWYYEKLYPMIFTVGALRQLKRNLESR